jgi:fructoselysine 6-phosphate deglycase
MAAELDLKQFLSSMQATKFQLDYAKKLGYEFAKSGIKRIFFVACGAPNREMSVMTYWLEKYSKQIEVRRYFPAEFVAQNPSALDEKTLIIFGSHSGTTPEMVQAAQFVKKSPSLCVGITQTDDSLMAQELDTIIAYGKSPDEGYQHGYYSMFMILLALVGSIMNEIEAWELYDSVMNSLDALPDVLADVMRISEKRAVEEARLYKDDRIFYLVGSGPMFCTAYVFGVCILMEMLWIHTYPGEAAEWFHGPFEIVDQDTPIFLLLGEDDSRPLMERVVRFCSKYTERLIIYDSKDYEMRGIAPEARPIFAPIIIQSGLDRLAEHLSVWHNHPLTYRRYMWKTAY